MVPSNESQVFMESLMVLHAIEQQLMVKTNFEDDQESAIDKVAGELIKSYVPFGDNGPQVTRQSAIALVNRFIGYNFISIFFCCFQ